MKERMMNQVEVESACQKGIDKSDSKHQQGHVLSAAQDGTVISSLLTRRIIK